MPARLTMMLLGLREIASLYEFCLNKRCRGEQTHFPICRYVALSFVYATAVICLYFSFVHAHISASRGVEGRRLRRRMLAGIKAAFTFRIRIGIEEKRRKKRRNKARMMLMTTTTMVKTNHASVKVSYRFLPLHFFA